MKYIILSMLLLLAMPVYAVTLQPGQSLVPVNEVQLNNIQLIYETVDGQQVLTHAVVRVSLYKDGTLITTQNLNVLVSSFPANVVTNLNSFGTAILNKYLQSRNLVQ